MYIRHPFIIPQHHRPTVVGPFDRKHELLAAGIEMLIVVAPYAKDYCPPFPVLGFEEVGMTCIIYRKWPVPKSALT